MKPEYKKLYIVATPIGNRDDISKRAIETLKAVKYIFCENPIYSKRFLALFDINAKLIQINKFSENKQFRFVLELLQTEDCALISDAGTPTISDPGQYLINQLLDYQIEIIPLPGANSIISALSVSGFKYHNFTFLGFLPKKAKLIEDMINKHRNSDLICFFESPNRINETLEILLFLFGDCEIFIAREMTKLYESYYRGVISKFSKLHFKGELVIILKLPSQKNSFEDDKINLLIKQLQAAKLSNVEISKIISKVFKLRKNQIYEQIKAIKD